MCVFFDTNSDGTGLCFESPKSDLPWRSPSSNAGYVGRSRPPQQPDEIDHEMWICLKLGFEPDWTMGVWFFLSFQWWIIYIYGSIWLIWINGMKTMTGLMVTMVIIWLMMVNNNLVGAWPTPLKKWWSEWKSVGMIIPFPTEWKVIIHSCSKPPTSDVQDCTWEHDLSCFRKYFFSDYGENSMGNFEYLVKLGKKLTLW